MDFEARSITKRLSAGVTLAIMAFNLTACSFFASGRQTITVSSEPGGAQVTINGEKVGTTPTEYSISRGDESSILVSKAGYDAQMRRTSKTLSAIGTVDIIGGCIWLVPFLGLLSNGAWEEEPANFAVSLSKTEK